MNKRQKKIERTKFILTEKAAYRRRNRDVPTYSGTESKDAPLPTTANSDFKRPTQAQQRALIISETYALCLDGRLSEGRTLAKLRKEVLGLNQTEYARLIGVSIKSLSNFETDKGNFTQQQTNKLFRPFGLRVGLVPISIKTLANAIDIIEELSPEDDNSVAF